MELIIAKILKLLSVVLLSSVKFVGGVPLAFTYDFGFLETILATTIGGISGVIVFLRFSTLIISAWEKWNISSGKKKKIFSKRSRWIIRLRQKHGLIGIAALTPVILSIPVGTFLAARFIPDQKKIILYMFLSVLFWSLLFSSLFELYKVSTLEDLQHHIIK